MSETHSGRAVAQWLTRDGRWLTVLSSPGESFKELEGWIRARNGGDVVEVRCRATPCARCGRPFSPDRKSRTRCEPCRRSRARAPVPRDVGTAAASDASSSTPR